MKEKIIGFFIILLVGALLLFVGVGSKNLGTPNEVYQIYLNGKKIGLIDSKQKLLDLIDEDQTSIKEQFNVDKVYPPTGLDIRKVITYSEELSKTEEVYNTIKETEPFTVSGYVATVYYQKEDDPDAVEKEPLKIYVIMTHHCFIPYINDIFYTFKINSRFPISS